MNSDTPMGEVSAPTDILSGFTLTQEECNTLADRIAAELRQRKKIGEERRMRAYENQLLSIERAHERYRSAVATRC